MTIEEQGSGLLVKLEDKDKLKIDKIKKILGTSDDDYSEANEVIFNKAIIERMISDEVVKKKGLVNSHSVYYSYDDGPINSLKITKLDSVGIIYGES